MGESKLMGVRLPVEELERLREAKWELRKPVNAIVKEAISEYLNKYLKAKKRRSSK